MTSRRHFLKSLAAAALGAMVRFYPATAEKAAVAKVECDYVEWITVAPRRGSSPEARRYAKAIEAYLNKLMHPHMPALLEDAMVNGFSKVNIEEIARGLYRRAVMES